MSLGFRDVIMYLEPREQQLVNTVKTFFSEEPGFVFEKVAGAGAFAVTLCFSNRFAGPNDYRKIAVKAQPSGNEGLEEEKRFLRTTAGRWLHENTIITEYVENGTLMDLQNRLGDPRALPNRLLWSIFLCLVNACVGMAYPPGNAFYQPRGPGEQLPEILPPGNRPPLNVEHADLHQGNIMIGNFDAYEHRLFPVLKIIDFGMAVPSDNAIEENIRAIGQVMCDLMWYGRDISTLVDDKLAGGNLDPTLDFDLLFVAAECIKDNPAERPTLSQLLSAVRPNIQKTYPDIPEETDAYIHQLLQEHLFNAS
ncbi:hypothetical protein RRF57_000981 [Xylaria bambusicola]|uniref:Protein kinase domain-containing protein n=1 Tax=Xylaria bambusicola TaxID=326684 RepID=A0AAN7YUL8_9PEZI